MALTQLEKRQINEALAQASRLLKQRLAEAATDSDDVMTKLRAIIVALSAQRETIE